MKSKFFVDSHKFVGWQRSRGFVVLYSVLIATIILSITLGISLIAYNEVLLSSAVAEGGEAFFAADSGAECALYWDRSRDAFGNIYQILCNLDGPLITTAGNQSEFQLNIYDEDLNEIGCAEVTVGKNVPIGTNEQGNSILGTEIISRGYNIPCSKLIEVELLGGQLPPRTVQREIRVTY